MPLADQLAEYNSERTRQARLIDYARWLSIRAGGGGVARYEEYWPRTVGLEIVRKHLELGTKAAVSAGTTTDATWALPLVTPKELREAFLTVVRPQEIVTQLPGVRHVPISTPIPTWNPTSPSAATWVAQNALKPMGALAFGSATLTGAKIQYPVVVSKELLMLSMPGSDQALIDILAFHVITGTNEEFINPARVAVLNERPGSVTNVGTLVTTANDPVVDANAVLTALLAARPTAKPVLIMDATAAKAVMATDQGRNLTYEGGTSFGAKTIVVPSAGKTIAAIDPSAVLVSDLGVEFDTSRHASLVMDSAPVGTAAQVVTSLWQTNMMAIRGERFITWKLTAATAVQYTTRA